MSKSKVPRPPKDHDSDGPPLAEAVVTALNSQSMPRIRAAKLLGLTRGAFEDAIRDNAFPDQCLVGVAKLLSLSSTAELERRYSFRRRRPKMTLLRRIEEDDPQTSVVEALNLQAQHVGRVFSTISNVVDASTLYRLLDHSSLFVFYSTDLMPLESTDPRLQEAVASAILRKAHFVYFFPTDKYIRHLQDRFGLEIDLRWNVRIERMREFRRAVCEYANERAKREEKPPVSQAQVDNQITVLGVNESPFCMPRTTIGLFRQGDESCNRRMTIRIPLIADSVGIIPVLNAPVGMDYATLVERTTWREWGRVLLEIERAESRDEHKLSVEQVLNLCARFSLGTFREWREEGATVARLNWAIEEIQKRRSAVTER